jgi:hypothetical protein
MRDSWIICFVTFCVISFPGINTVCCCFLKYSLTYYSTWCTCRSLFSTWLEVWKHVEVSTDEYNDSTIKEEIHIIIREFCFIFTWIVIASIFPWTWRNFFNFSWLVKRQNIFTWKHIVKRYRGPSVLYSTVYYAAKPLIINTSLRQTRSFYYIWTSVLITLGVPFKHNICTNNTFRFFNNHIICIIIII